MKKIKYLLTFLFVLGTILPVSAAVTAPDWTKLQIGSTYNKSTQEMKIATLIPGVTKTFNSDYTINLRIDGTDFLQTFTYDDAQDLLSANFTNFTKVLLTSYPYSYSIKSTKNAQVLYTYTGTLVFNGTTGNSVAGVINSGTGSSSTGSTLSQDQKDAQSIYTIVLSTIPKSITTTLGKIDYLETVIDSLEAYIVKYPNRKGALSLAISKLQTQILVYKDPSIKRSYIPKYKSRAEEPTIINGIGNSPSYKSWRVD